MIFSRKDILYWLPSLLLIWVFSIIQSKSLLVASFFILSLLVIMFCAFVVCYLFIKLLRKSSKNIKHSLLRWEWTRRPAPNVVCVSILSVCLTVVYLIPQLYKNFIKQLQNDKDYKYPSFFVFDIPGESFSSIDEWVRGWKKRNIELTYKKNQGLDNGSPVIRGRLLEINSKKVTVATGYSFEKSQRDWENSLRSRTYNLSIRQKPSSSESIVKGRDFSTTVDNSNYEMSLEYRFASRLGVSLGDTLTFVIGGKK